MSLNGTEWRERGFVHRDWLFFVYGSSTNKGRATSQCALKFLVANITLKMTPCFFPTKRWKWFLAIYVVRLALYVCLKNICDGVGGQDESNGTPLDPPLFWLDNIFKYCMYRIHYLTFFLFRRNPNCPDKWIEGIENVAHNNVHVHYFMNLQQHNQILGLHAHGSETGCRNVFCSIRALAI